MNTATCNPMIELYFSELESKMAGLPKPARQEFLQELRAHVLDRLQQTAEPTETQCRAVLVALGAPEEIARHYLIETALSRARRSNSPLLLLRSTLRWALTGMQGFAVFMAALVGYMTALGRFFRITLDCMPTDRMPARLDLTLPTCLTLTDTSCWGRISPLSPCSWVCS